MLLVTRSCLCSLQRSTVKGVFGRSQRGRGEADDERGPDPADRSDLVFMWELCVCSAPETESTGQAQPPDLITEERFSTERDSWVHCGKSGIL